MNLDDEPDDELTDHDAPLSYHIKVTQRTGEPLTSAQTLGVQSRAWNVLFAIFGSEAAVVKAAQDDEASVSAAAIILWEGAWAKAGIAGRFGLPAGVRVELSIAFHHTF